MRTLTTDKKTTPQEMQSLPLSKLYELQHEAEAALTAAKEQKAAVDAALEFKLLDEVRTRLMDSRRDTGTVRFVREDCQVIAELPKRVVWDQEQLADIVGQLPPEIKAESVRVQFSIDERNYHLLPEVFKELIKPARTVKTGKPRFYLSPLVSTKKVDSSTEIMTTDNTATQNTQNNRDNSNNHFNKNNTNTRGI
jgi:hypothetical protein